MWVARYWEASQLVLPQVNHFVRHAHQDLRVRRVRVRVDLDPMFPVKHVDRVIHAIEKAERNAACFWQAPTIKRPQFPQVRVRRFENFGRDVHCSRHIEIRNPMFANAYPAKIIACVCGPLIKDSTEIHAYASVTHRRSQKPIHFTSRVQFSRLPTGASAPYFSSALSIAC